MPATETEAKAVARRFGENLILRRRRAGFSQEKAAKRAGMFITHFGLLERGQRLPRLDTIIKVAGAIEVEPCELLSGMAWQLPAGRPPGDYAESVAELGSEEIQAEHR